MSSMPVTRRRLPMGILIVSLMVVAALLGANARQDTARLAGLEIVHDGQVVATIGGDANGGVIRLRNSRGTETLVLRMDDKGGVLIDIRDPLGDRALAIETDNRRVEISTQTKGRKLLVFVSDDIDDPDDLNSFDVLARRVASLSLDMHAVRTAQSAHDRRLRDLDQPITASAAMSRLERDIADLKRDIDVQARDTQRVEDDVRRQGSDVDDVRRRVSRLESKIRE